MNRSDHLNTPRIVADATGTTVWRWDQAEPFRDSPANENSSGAGTFDLPLRLPGQYYAPESGLHYNYFRGFDPVIGRCVQSDPIGLMGGGNSYAYAFGGPLVYFDARGKDPLVIAGVIVGAIAGGWGAIASSGNGPINWWSVGTGIVAGISAFNGTMAGLGAMARALGMANTLGNYLAWEVPGVVASLGLPAEDAPKAGSGGLWKSAIAEARMRSSDLREVKILLATSVTIFIVHASLLVHAISRLDFVFQHPNNIAIVLVLICWASIAVLLSSWGAVIFAVHVTSVRFAEGGLVLSCLLAARKRISRVRRIRKIVVPVPALGGVGYTRGVLIICTSGLFYIADAFPERILLVERFLAMSSGAYSCPS